MPSMRRVTTGIALLLLAVVSSTVLLSGSVLRQDALPSGMDLSFLRPAAAAAPNPAGRPAHCPVDHYLQPGLLHINDDDPSETRWVPLEVPGLVANLDGVAYADINDRDDGPLGVKGGETHFNDLAAGRLDGLEWARDQVILLVGSSHDRNNLQQLAEILGLKYKTWGGHRGGYLRVPSLNLTFVNYFLFGMIDDDDAKWFAKVEKRPLRWESRLPLVDAKRVAAGIPDPTLTVVASLFWDEKLFKAMFKDEFGDARTRTHPSDVGLTLPEARWHSSRVASLLEHIRATWPRSRLMIRTRHHRASDAPGARLRISQIDNSCRASASRVGGVQLFRWGDVLEGYEKYHDGDQHFALGPTTYLAGDMLLFYLHQAVLPGCWPSS